jgi:hypothetical protein
MALLVAFAGWNIGSSHDCNYSHCSIISKGMVGIGLAFAVLFLILAWSHKGPKQY